MHHLISRAPLVFAAALALLVVRPAAAAPPSHESFVDQFADVPFADRGDFQTLGSATVDVRVTTFFDDAGTPVRVQDHVQYAGTIENSVTGATLADPRHLTNTLDLVSGEDRTVGLVFQTTVPGIGTIVKEVGSLILGPDGDVIVRGPHEVLEAGGYQIYCQYLA